MNKKNILWISYFVPYDGVPHAGGKIHNFYIKGLDALNKYNIRLLTCAKEEECNKIDLDKTTIEYSLYISKSSDLMKKLIEKLDYWSFWTKRSGFLSRYKREYFLTSLKELKQSGYIPDIIVLQWTQVVLMELDVKEIYPTVPIICIEEDVSYLSFFRRFLYEKNPFKRALRKRVYEQLKKQEIECLKNADLIILNNFKDNRLLEKENIHKTWVWTPFFQNFIDKDYLGDKNELLFYGAMSRDENWKSVLWFVDKVLPYLDSKDVRFVVVGGNPHKELLKLNNPQVLITGYVDDVSEYFSHAKCLVAPLVLGAGVKIKVLEAMSAGLPVVTNDIGIEGIAAQKDSEYLHCEKPEDYIAVLNEILAGQIDLAALSKRSKKVINEKYDIEKSMSVFEKQIDKLIAENG